MPELLTGIKDIGYARRFEFKPYGLGGFEKTEIHLSRAKKQTIRESSARTLI